MGTPRQLTRWMDRLARDIHRGAATFLDLAAEGLERLWYGH